MASSAFGLMPDSSPAGAYMSQAELSEELTFQRAILESIQDEPVQVRDEAAIEAAKETIKRLERQMRKLRGKSRGPRIGESPSTMRGGTGPSARRSWDVVDLENDPFADSAPSNGGNPFTSIQRTPSKSHQLNMPTRQRSPGGLLRRASPIPLDLTRSPTPSTSGDDDISKELERAQRAAELRAKRERDDAEYARRLQEELSGGSATSALTTSDSSGPSTSSSEDSIAWSAPQSGGFTAFDRLLGRQYGPSSQPSSQNQDSSAMLDQPRSNMLAESDYTGRPSMPGAFDSSDSDSELEMISASSFRDNGRHSRVGLDLHSIYNPPRGPFPPLPPHMNNHDPRFPPLGPISNPTTTREDMSNPDRRSWGWDSNGAGFGSRAIPGLQTTMSSAMALARGVGNFLHDGSLESLMGNSSGRSYNYASMVDMYGNPLDSRAASAVDYYVNDPRKTHEEIKALLENIRPDQEIPKENREGTPDGLKYPLYEHQKLALTWMKSMEEGTNHGGILADDMGLGKTITTLALLLSRPSTDKVRKTTLIVGPVALVRQWEREIQVKINSSHRLSCFLYHSGKKASWDELRTYDVVLTTYGTIGSEYKRLLEYEKKVREDSGYANAYNSGRYLPFLGPKSKFYRVILDEAQYIKNKHTKAAHAACHLQSKYRFCLTGTPMMNGVGELYSLIHFLRIKPYNDSNKFTEDFGVLSKGGQAIHRQERAMQKLQAVLKAILLRRTKQSEIDGKPILQLPPKTEEVVHAVFSQDERDYYGALESKSRVQFNKYLRENAVGKNYSNILVLLLRLRQAACHPHLIMDFEEAPTEATVEEMEALAKILTPEVVARIIAATVPFECPVCYDPVPNPRIVVPCGHDTCSECLVKITENVNQNNIANGVDGACAKCPSCRGEVNPQKIIDYETFKKVHMPSSSSAAVKEDEEETESEGDGDSVDLDSDDDSENGSDTDSDDDSDLPDIRDFVVPDGYVSADEVVDEADEDDEDTDDLDIKTRPKKEAVKEEPYIKHDADDDEDDDIVIKTSRPNKRKAKAIDEDDEDFEPDGGKISKKVATKKIKSIDKKAKKTKKSKKGKSRDKKGKGKEKDELEPKSMSLSKLKKEASKSVEGRRRYMRYLRKNWISSAKVDKCLEILASRTPGIKTIIFSQFTTLLDLVEVPLRNQETRFVRYDGSMSAPKRHQAVEKFTDDPRFTIMLVSLKAGNAGLNLVAASQVIILDPFWNPFIEMQAVDRAHRIGQQKPVTVHRILVQETVEDRIIELQKRKKTLVDAALSEKASQGLGRLSQNELRYLFNGGEAPAMEQQRLVVNAGPSGSSGATAGSFSGALSAPASVFGSADGHSRSGL